MLPSRFLVPRDSPDAVVRVGGKDVRLTNIAKPFWPELGITKGDPCGTTRTCRPCCCLTCAIAPW